MRLTHIKLAGFKSFVDPTTLSLSSNLTGVVGPNGCGKSNVIDAVRWVTGESNARQLRGEALEDVIFNGANSRKPVGRASVELRFDNSDARLGGEWSAYAEISVRRELTRDGASKYFINDTRARRRDVVDLFLGTGLGGRNNYAVIEQGAVNRLIEAKPEEMRQVLEEAAGISRYKERRRETENRIRHTRDNLDRLDDLIGEVGQRLTTLKRQASDAERYKRLKADERRLSTELLALRWQRESASVNTAQARLSEIETELRETISQRRAAIAEREAAAEAQQQASETVQNAQAVFYDAQAEAGRIEQALKHARELSERVAQERRSLVTRLEQANERRQADETRHAELTAELEQQAEQHREARAAHDTARQARNTAEREAEAAEQAWDTLSQQATNPVQQREAEKTRARYAQAEYDKLVSRRDKRAEEQARLDPTGDETLDTQTAHLDKLHEAQQAGQARLDALKAELAAEEERLATAENTLAETRRALADAEAEHTAARRMQQALLREDDATIRAWFADNDLGEPVGLARRIHIDAEWQTAARHVLADWLAAFVIAGDAPIDSIDHTPDERLTLVMDNASADVSSQHVSEDTSGLACLADHVRGPAPVMAAAARIRVAEDLESALAARERLAANQTIVTKTGLVVGPDWLITPPPADADTPSPYDREARIAELDETITACKARIEETHAIAETARERRQSQATACQELERAQADRRREIETAEAELEGQRHRAAENQRRRDELATELADLTTQLTETERTRQDAETAIETLNSEAERFEADRARARERRDTARQQRDRARGEAGQARRAVEQIEAEQARLASRRDELARRIAESRDAAASLNDELRVFDAENEASDTQTPTAADLDTAREGKDEAEQALREARRTAETRDNALAKARETELGADQRMEQVRERQGEARLALEAASTRREGVVEQLREAGAAPAPIVAELPENANIEAWQSEITRVGERINRLGAINLAAIDEYEEAAERERYLGAQRTDLTEALDTLEAAIARIDRETRQRFKQTYEQIDQRFSSLFPSLFGGGEAALSLTEEDWLTTGVRVMARPPGKRNASIQMLSGGEKTLTAVALLFALFELNPAPFCMLDEIDAPLDDANVARFCDLVRTMADKVQFIVITHNKLTMELTEQLHGVTMAEPGVSRLVSVDIDTALDMAG